MNTTQGHKALRRGRWSERGRIYHVTFATRERSPWFSDWYTAVTACRTFEPSAHAADAELVCWVLMPDHFHGLLQVGDAQSLSRCVQRLKGRATQACRRICGERADLWARGFFDRAVRRDDDVIQLARYIVGNPLRANLVTNVLDYPFWNATWL